VLQMTRSILYYHRGFRMSEWLLMTETIAGRLHIYGRQEENNFMIEGAF